ncbi:MAG: Tetratricopeptide (TPR) repeat [Verrucomicrobia bacterium]|jgi:tetratricopeptide (TPR) repeat protein|nr:MAG: Tetratricopeptide (TPR) repeat [Verrucomicrobiota bacterium]
MPTPNTIYLSATRRDEEQARLLQEGFERFRVPEGVALSADRLRFARGRTMVRHEAENPRVTDIPEEVREMIRSGEMMILLCSAAAASSRWIAAELEVYYAARPRAVVIPVVLEGEPVPDGAGREAYEKPCFPENLRQADQERWISAKGPGGVAAAVTAVLALVLGVRVEELVYFVDRRATRLARERGVACVAGAAAMALSGLWSFRENIHLSLIRGNDGYAGGWGRDVESFLATFRPSRTELDPPDKLQPTSALPPPGPQPVGTEVAVAQPKPEPVPEPMQVVVSPFAGSPEALRLALKAWLDRAESHLPGEPEEAREWLRQSGAALESASPGEFGSELYRLHALLAVAARCHGDAETAKAELARAIGFWTQIPVRDPQSREAEAFEILATISPGPEWTQSVELMVSWLTDQPAAGEELESRAVKLQELARARPFLIPLVDGFFSKAVERMQPAPVDRVAERARWDLIRASFAEETGRKERASAILTAAMVSLERDGSTAAGLHRSLKAQIEFREGRDRSENRARMLREVIPALEEGSVIAGWQEWFTRDAAAAWSLTGDLLLEKGENGEAIKSYNRAVEYADTPRTLADLLLRSGCAYRYAGDPGGAWDAFSLALPIFEKAGDQSAQAVALYGQTLAARELGRPEEALSLASRADDLRKRLGRDWKPPLYWREALDKVSPPTPALAPVAVESLDYDPLIEAKIAKVRQEIGVREAKQPEPEAPEELQELQSLYQELDRLLREKITGSAKPAPSSLEVEVLKRKR